MDTEHKSPPESGMTRCIACKRELPGGASVCSHCNSYQSDLQNKLIYVAKISVIIIPIVGAIYFGITKLPEFYKVIFGKDDISVVSFNSDHLITVANTGDGEVSVSDVYLRFRFDSLPGELTQTKTASFKVKPDSIESQSIQGGDRSHTEVISNVSDEQWRQILTRLMKRDFSCFHPLVFNEQNLQYLQIIESPARRRRTYRVDAALHYYSTGHKDIRAVSFPAAGVVVGSKSAECQLASKQTSQ